MWHTPDLEGYFVANDLSAYKLAQWGMDPARIHVTGIPVHPVFSSPLDRTELCKMYGLDTNLITFLFITGSLNIAYMERILNNIAKEGHRFQMILVTGRNEKLYHALSGLKVPQNVSIYPFGYVKDIEKLMTVSDLIITKPGGLTVSESLARKLPLLMIFPIPGQEDHNADYILECGAGLKANSLMELEYKIRFLLDNPYYIETMKKKAERCRKPDAARDIIQKILEFLSSP
jgi:processive 1,2-diacylglycerol beta-glucosyltransferase